MILKCHIEYMVNLHCVPKKRPPYYFFEQLCQKLTNFNEKILHKNLTELLISPVRCSHFTLENPKKVIFNSIIHILQTTYVTSEENKQQLLYCSFSCLLTVV